MIAVLALDYSTLSNFMQVVVLVFEACSSIKY